MEMKMENVTRWARLAGMQHKDQAWLLHDYDVWVRNPHYTGPAIPHPEDDGPFTEEELAAQQEWLDGWRWDMFAHFWATLAERIVAESDPDNIPF